MYRPAKRYAAPSGTQVHSPHSSSVISQLAQSTLRFWTVPCCVLLWPWTLTCNLGEELTQTASNWTSMPCNLKVIIRTHRHTNTDPADCVTRPLKRPVIINITKRSKKLSIRPNECCLVSRTFRMVDNTVTMEWQLHLSEGGKCIFWS